MNETISKIETAINQYKEGLWSKKELLNLIDIEVTDKRNSLYLEHIKQ